MAQWAPGIIQRLNRGKPHLNETMGKGWICLNHQNLRATLRTSHEPRTTRARVEGLLQWGIDTIRGGAEEAGSSSNNFPTMDIPTYSQVSSEQKTALAPTETPPFHNTKKPETVLFKVDEIQHHTKGTR